MTSPSCLILDDIESSLSKASPLGRKIMAEPARRVQRAVAGLAERRGWILLPHEQFVAWAETLSKHDDPTWVVLDPLFPGKPERVGFRLSRVAGAGAGSLDGPPLSFGAASRIAIVDDAIGSGRTVAYVARSARASGISVERVIACAAAPASIAAVRKYVPGAKLDLYVRDEMRIVHLRDGCPHLPFAGRATGRNVVGITDANATELRILPRYIQGSPWQAIALDRAVAAAIGDAQTDICNALGRELGRPATLGDLPMLGAAVSAMIQRGQTGEAGTPLDALLPGQS